MNTFKKSVIRNGIRVVSEHHPHSRAVSLGIWVLTGTRDERAEQAGIAHFLEHLVFKGTKTRSAYQIAKSLEVVGGELNAYTTREFTVYHCLILKEHWRKGLEILSDLVSNMKLRASDLAVERSVILQEIGMAEDDLEDLIYDEYFARTLPKSSLGRPILGHVQSIATMKARDIKRYYQQNYSAGNIIVSAAGDISHEELVTACRQHLGHKKALPVQRDRKRPKHQVHHIAVEKTSEQLHLCAGLPVTSFRDQNRFDALIVNALLGGGMTSKLYQSVRERRGLAYTIYSSLNTFENFGCINIYAACEKKNMPAVLTRVRGEIAKLAQKKVSRNELEMFKTQVKGAILLGADDIENRMTSIAVNEMVFGHYKSVDTVIAEINRVSVDSVNEFIKKYISLKHLSVVIMGSGAEDMKGQLCQN